MDGLEEKLYAALGLTAPGNAEGSTPQSLCDSSPCEGERQTGEQQSGNDAAETDEAPENSEGSTPQSLRDSSPCEGERQTGEQQSGNDAPETDGKDAQSAEERRSNAARRRAKEQQEAIDAAVQQALTAERAKTAEEIKSFFSRANLQNSMTGKPITSMEEFDEWEKGFSDARLTRELEEGKLTRETLDRLIAANPEIRRAREVNQQAEAEEKSRRAAADKAQIEEQLAEIHKLDPTISEIGDLMKMENAEAFYAYVKKGNSFTDAYYLANREKLSRKQAEAAKQAAINNTRGKEHLRGTGNARGEGTVSVPSDTMRYFKLFSPKATDAQIQAYYNKNRKG